MSKFDSIILKNLISQTGEPIIENAPPPVDPAMQDPAAAPPVDPAAAAAPVEQPAAPPDEPAIKINMLDLARRALLIDPNTLDQSTKGVLSSTVTPENAGQMEEVISSVTSIESDVNTGGGDIDYNNIN